MNSPIAYIGCYTGQGRGQGITPCRMDADTGALTALEAVTDVPSPSFLCLSPSKDRLFTVNEQGKVGGVSSFGLDHPERPAFLNQQSSQGGSPCHLCTDPAGKYLFVANHNDGSVAVFPISADGQFGEASDVQRKEGGNAHWVGFDPSGQFLFAVDKGHDRVWAYRHSSGKLAAYDPAFFELPKGTGPRHLAFHPNGHFAYVNGEKDMTLHVLAYDGERGQFASIQKVSTLPEGAAGSNFTTAEVVAHPNGKRVYVSNRGHNSVATFSIDGDGKVASMGHISVGKNPRHATLDPGGRNLYVSCQDDHRIEVYRLGADGLPSANPTSKLETGAPVCLIFL